MTNAMQSLRRKAIRGIGRGQIRLVCGVIMFVYLLSHFLNHALGNISLDALKAGVLIHMRFWQFTPVALVFYAATTIHAGLGIWALYERRQFHRVSLEPLQLLLGLSIPALIVSHVVSMRLGQVLFQQQRGYEQVFYANWVAAPLKMWLIYLVVLVSWIHGCIGLYFWLRVKSFFKPAAPFLLAAAILIPTLAMLGLYQGGRTVMRDSVEPDWTTRNLSVGEIGTPTQQGTLDAIASNLLIGYCGLIALALVARGVRGIVDGRVGMITMSYGDGRTMRVPKGLSVLEASLRFQVPHASVCGGRARCSTCRIRVIGDPRELPEPSAREAFVLDRVGASGDPSIRLACQLRPTSDIAFVQLFTPHAMTANAHAANPARIGQERYLVSMFIDMRGSTSLAEKRLPFDTVFIVNRFLGAVSEAVLASGGQPNQFVGDGMLALFGLTTDPKTACRQALQAAAAISLNIDELNRILRHDLPQPIRFGIGIHAGEVIVGDIGYRDHMVFTALGDAVNVAARLQDMTKTLACQIIISDDVCRTACVAANALATHIVVIRGRDEPMMVHATTSAAGLSELVKGGAVFATQAG